MMSRARSGHRVLRRTSWFVTITLLVGWFVWLIPHLRAPSAQPRPGWAQGWGFDALGRYGEMDLGHGLMRFHRYPGPDAPESQHLQRWRSDTALTRGQWRAVMGQAAPGTGSDQQVALVPDAQLAQQWARRQRALQPGITVVLVADPNQPGAWHVELSDQP